MEEQTTSVVIEQQGEQKKRGALAVILAVAFVAMLGIGTTFAYLTYVGNQTPNRFTTDRGLTVDVLEPAWTQGAKDAGGEYPYIASDGIGIPKTANNMSEATGAQVVAKDPFVVNTSKVGNETDPGKDAYVGIRLTFQKWVATKVSGDEADHTEEGQYVTMSDGEVDKLLAVYALTTQASGSVDTAAADTAATPGITVNEGWTQVVKSTGGESNSGKSTDGAMYFVYKTALAPVGKITTDATSDMNSVVSGKTTQKASTKTLFDKVVYTNLTGADATETDKARTDLAEILNKGKYLRTDTVVDKLGYESEVDVYEDNATTDPGWRVVVSTAAVQATDSTAEISTDLALAINNAYTDLAADGSNATGSKKGSGWRSEFTNPESTWTR